jgi:hypothetical protein
MGTQIRLTCDGCGATSELVTSPISRAGGLVRRVARGKGWQTRPIRNLDFCPRCVKGGKVQQVVNGKSKFVNGDAAFRLTPEQLKRGEQNGRSEGAGAGAGADAGAAG